MRVLLILIETICITIIFFFGLVFCLSLNMFEYETGGRFEKEEMLAYSMYVVVIFLFLRVLARNASVKIQSVIVLSYLFVLYYVRFSGMFTSHILSHLTMFGTLSLIIISLMSLYRRP